VAPRKPSKNSMEIVFYYDPGFNSLKFTSQNWVIALNQIKSNIEQERSNVNVKIFYVSDKSTTLSYIVNSKVFVFIGRSEAEPSYQLCTYSIGVTVRSVAHAVINAIQRKPYEIKTYTCISDQPGYNYLLTKDNEIKIEYSPKIEISLNSDLKDQIKSVLDAIGSAGNVKAYITNPEKAIYPSDLKTQNLKRVMIFIALTDAGYIGSYTTTDPRAVESPKVNGIEYLLYQVKVKIQPYYKFHDLMKAVTVAGAKCYIGFKNIILYPGKVNYETIILRRGLKGVIEVYGKITISSSININNKQIAEIKAEIESVIEEKEGWDYLNDHSHLADWLKLFMEYSCKYYKLDLPEDKINTITVKDIVSYIERNTYVDDYLDAYHMVINYSTGCGKAILSQIFPNK